MPQNAKALDVRVRVNKRAMETYLQRSKLRVFDALSWWAETAAEQSVRILQPAIQQETPIETGALQLSTGSRVTYTRGRVRPGVRVEFVQTATNRNGEHYGQFLISGFHRVVFGHRTGTYRPPDDYPLRAYQNVYGDLREMLQYTATLSWFVGVRRS